MKYCHNFLTTYIFYNLNSLKECYTKLHPNIHSVSLLLQLLLLIFFNWGRNQKISLFYLYLHRPAFTSKVEILPTKKIFPHKNVKYFNIENILILYIQHGINLFDILKVFSIKRSYVRECDFAPPSAPNFVHSSGELLHVHYVISAK